MQMEIGAGESPNKEYVHCFTIGVRLDAAYQVIVDTRNLKIRGKIDASTGPILNKIALSFRGFVQKILSAGPGDIFEEYETVISRVDGDHRLLYRTYVTNHFQEKVLSPECRIAIEAYISEISGRQEEARIEIGEAFTSVVKKSAIDFKKNYGGKTIPLNLTVDMASGETIAFPRQIAVWNQLEQTTKTRESVGAFRGFFIESRVAYFLEYKDRRGKCLLINFDEEQFFDRIRSLSSRHFTRCTIVYEEHISNDKVEYLRLKAISSQTDDIFEP
jgi:hypothetical protein